MNDNPNPNLNLELFRPMLAATIPCAKNRVPTQDEMITDLRRLNWERGFLVSPKLDGIRCIKHPSHGLVTRTLTQVPNRFIQECLSSNIFNHFDGELIKGLPEHMVNFNDTQSAVMSREGSPFFTYCIFDNIEKPNIRFNWRTEYAKQKITQIQEGTNFQGLFAICWVQQTLVHSLEELLAVEEEYLLLGYEGVIIRDPWGAYKNNRSTFKQQGMIKIKRFLDAEARITGFTELKRNANEATTSALGYTKRSSHQENKIAAGTLGTLIVEGINGRFKGVEFEIGVGFDEKQRQDIWNSRHDPKWATTLVRYKYQDAGSKNKPRIPIWLGFRDARDLS